MNDSRMSFAISTRARKSARRGKAIRADERDKLVSMLGRLPIASVSDLTGRPVMELAKLIKAQREAV